MAGRVIAPRAGARRSGAAPAGARRAWVVLEDCLYRALRCSPVERTLYNHLLRHTLLEGRRVVRRTKAELSRATGICGTAVRDNLRALEAKACLRIRERAKCGLLIEVCWPPEARAAGQGMQKAIQNSRFQIPDKSETESESRKTSRCKIQEESKDKAETPFAPLRVVRSKQCECKIQDATFKKGQRTGTRRESIEHLKWEISEKRGTTRTKAGGDLWNGAREDPTEHAQQAARKSRAGASSRTPGYEALGRRRPAKNPFKSARFRQTIRRREGGRCFYCQRRLPTGNWGLDHVVSRAQEGGHTADNAAACCGDCNREKGEQGAAEFLASLHGQGRLDELQLAQRMKALRVLQGQRKA